MSAVRKSPRKVVKFDDSVDKGYRAKILSLFAGTQRQAINYLQPQQNRQLDAQRIIKLRRIYDPVYEVIQEILNKCLGDICEEKEYLMYSGLSVTCDIQLQTVDINVTRKQHKHPIYQEFRIHILPPNGKTFVREQFEFEEEEVMSFSNLQKTL